MSNKLYSSWGDLPPPPLTVAISAAKEKGTPVGVVYRARGPALGSWEDQAPAAYEEFLG